MNKFLQTEPDCFRIAVDGAVYRGRHDHLLCPPAELPEFVNELGDIANGEGTLKQGDRTRVSRVSWKRHDLVIKHYFHRNVWHSLRCLVKKSRACHSWEAAREFFKLGIPTPKPLAYVERWRRGLAWESFLITEYLPGMNLAVYLKELTTERDRDIVGQLADMLETLSRHGIIHGDLKATNIGVARDGLYLTDLDGVEFHGLGAGFASQRARDHTRLFRDVGPDRRTLLETMMRERLSIRTATKE